MLRVPESAALDVLPMCAPLRGAVNESGAAVRIEGWFLDVAGWVPLIPRVEAASSCSLKAGAIWLPRSTLLRSVEPLSGDLVTLFGAIGDGMTVVQKAA
jgi:hypothetical protein